MFKKGANKLSASDEYMRVEDKATSSWLIIRASFSGNEIVARTKSKYHAQDVVLALNMWSKAQGEDGLRG